MRRLSLLGSLTIVLACGGDDTTTTSVPPDASGDQSVADTSVAPDASDASPKATVPGAPTMVQALANEAKGASVSWMPPTSDGGSPILSYTVTAVSNAVKVTTTDPKVLSTLVLGLKLGAETFTVHATNAVGDGPESAASTGITVVDGLAVSGLVACWGDTKLSMYAPAVANAKSLNLYWGTKPGVTRANGTKIANVTLPYVHTGLTNGTPLYYVLTAVDGSMVESVESNEATGLPDSTIHDVMAVNSFSQNKSIDFVDCVARFADQTNGTTRTLTGNNTKLATFYYGQVVIDAKNKRLYVSGTNGVTEWDNADTVNGNVAPTRTINTGSTSAIALDVTHDVLYASVGNNVLSFAKASTLSGNVSAAATLGTNGATQLSVDEKNDRLWVAYGGGGPPKVWDKASTLSGTIGPSDRTITIVGPNTMAGIAYDGTNDVLYIGSRNDDSIYAVASGATANGTVMPARKITVAPNLGAIMNIAYYPSSDTLGAMTDSGPYHILNKASTLNGMVMVGKTVKTSLMSLGGFSYAP